MIAFGLYGKHCYALEDFKGLFYKDFTTKIVIAILYIIIIRIRGLLRNRCDYIFPC